MRTCPSLAFVWCVFLAFAASAKAQQISPPATASPLAQSLAAQTGGAATSDLALTGTISFPNSVQTGSFPVTLIALANGTSQMVATMPAGTVTHVWSNTGTPSISIIGASGTAQTQAAGQNTVMPGAAWFSPAVITALVSGSGYTLADAGSAKKNGVALHHYVATPVASNQSQIDLYIDPTTSLPAALVFQVNPYHAPGPTISATPHAVTVPEEIRFSNYQPVQGGMVPFHIQAYLGQMGMQIMDITLSSALLNTGVSISVPTVSAN